MKNLLKFNFSEKLRTTTVKEAGIRAAIFYTGKRIGNRTALTYKVWHKGKLLFIGDDYRPSPMIGYESKDSIMELLAFISLQPGDTDDEYFEKYTPEQMAFAKSYDAELLGYAVSDWEEKSSRKSK